MFTKDSKKRNIFRQESLERLSSPERLDQLMQVVGPKEWVPLSVLGGLVIVGLAWSIFGKIPITIDGRGIFIAPRQVVDFQSPISGQLKTLYVQAGQCIAKNERLATIDPSELKQRLKLAQDKQAQLQQQSNQTSLLLNQGTRSEQDAIIASKISLQQRLLAAQSMTPMLQNKGLDAIVQQRQSLQQRLQDLQQMTPLIQSKGLDAIVRQRQSIQQQLQDTKSLTPTLKEKGLNTITEQRQSLQQRLENAKKLAPVLAERLEKRRQLFSEGAIPQDTLLEAEQEYFQKLESVAELKAELKDLDAREVEAQQQYLENLNQIGALQAKLKDIDVQEATTQQQYLNSLNQINEIQAQLKDLEVKETESQQRHLENLNQIRQTQADLQELETKAKRLEQDNLEQLNNKQNPIQDVRREIAQLQQQIIDNSEIRSPHAGCILEITATEGQVVAPGTNLGSLNVTSRKGTLVGVSYFTVKDGKKIKPGMMIQITPDTVKRQRYGGIVGTVTSVSEFPITQKGAAAVIGNPDIVSGLIQSVGSGTGGGGNADSGAIVEVRSQLESDQTPSGYKWSSSQGPELKITPGITTTARVRVEEQAPITFLLPVLREWTGIY